MKLRKGTPSLINSHLKDKLKMIEDTMFNMKLHNYNLNTASVDELPKYSLKCIDPDCFLTYTTTRLLFRHILTYPHKYSIISETEQKKYNNASSDQDINKIRCPICYEIITSSNPKEIIENLIQHCETKEKHTDLQTPSLYKNLKQMFTEIKTETHRSDVNIRSLLFNPLFYLQISVNENNKVIQNLNNQEKELSEANIFEILFFRQIIVNSFKGLFLFMVEDMKYICRFAGCHKILGSTEATRYHISHFLHSFYQLFVTEINRLEEVSNKNSEEEFNIITLEDYKTYKEHIPQDEVTENCVYDHLIKSYKTLFNLGNTFNITNAFIYMGYKQDHDFPILVELDSYSNDKKKMSVRRTLFINRNYLLETLKKTGREQLIKSNKLVNKNILEKDASPENTNLPVKNIFVRDEAYSDFIKKHKQRKSLEKHSLSTILKFQKNSLKMEKLQTDEIKLHQKLCFQSIDCNKLLKTSKFALFDKKIICILRDLKNHNFHFIALKEPRSSKRKTLLIKMTASFEILLFKQYKESFYEMLHYNNDILVRTKKGTVLQLDIVSLECKSFNIIINNVPEVLENVDSMYPIYDIKKINVNKFKSTKKAKLEFKEDLAQNKIIPTRLWYVKKNVIYLLYKNIVVFKEEFEYNLKQIIYENEIFILLFDEGRLFSYEKDVFGLKNSLDENYEPGKLTKLERNYGFDLIFNLYSIEDAILEIKSYFNGKYYGDALENRIYDILSVLTEFRHSLVVKNNFRGNIHRLDLKKEGSELKSSLQLITSGFFVICKYIPDKRCIVGVTSMGEVYLLIGTRQKEKIFLFRVLRDFSKKSNSGKLLIIDSMETLRKHLMKFGLKEEEENLSVYQVLVYSNLIVPVDMFYYKNVFTLLFKGGLVCQFELIF
ncbi:hypothetical protein CDIK_1142 [Cucumispora dikerogammari]|nr:hypothetical protein CDIK_1142 [Cucumispora dikerogammari]